MNNHKFLLIYFTIISIQLCAQKTSISAIKQPRKPYSIEIDNEVSTQLIQNKKLKILQSFSLENLISSSSDEDENIRLRAIENLGYFNDESSRIILEKYLLKDPSPLIRVACAQSLNIQRNTTSIPSLIKGLNDEYRAVQIYSAFTLAQLGEKYESMNFYKKLYSNGFEIPYYSCHQGFLYIGLPYAQQYLVNDLKNKDPFIAVDAAIMLAELGDIFHSYPVLKSLLSNPDKYIQMACLRGLAYIGDQNSLILIESKITSTDKLVAERASIILNNYQKY